MKSTRKKSKSTRVPGSMPQEKAPPSTQEAVPSKVNKDKVGNQAKSNKKNGNSKNHDDDRPSLEELIKQLEERRRRCEKICSADDDDDEKDLNTKTYASLRKYLKKLLATRVSAKQALAGTAQDGTERCSETVAQHAKMKQLLKETRSEVRTWKRRLDEFMEEHGIVSSKKKAADAESDNGSDVEEEAEEPTEPIEDEEEVDVTDSDSDTDPVTYTPESHEEARRLQQDPSSSHFWKQCAEAMSRRDVLKLDGDSGSAYKKKHVYAKCLELDSANADVWISLGDTMQGTKRESCVVQHKAYTGIDCFVQALRYDASNALGWYRVAFNYNSEYEDMRGPLTINGEELTLLQRRAKAIEASEGVAAAWARTGGWMDEGDTITVCCETYTKLETIARSVEIDDETGWGSMGFYVKSGEKVIVHGQSFTKRQCYYQDLRRDTEKSEAWSKMGVFTRPTDTVELDKTYTQRECFLKALELDNHNDEGWDGLSTLSMADDEEVTINDTPYNRVECLAESVAADHERPSVWAHLAILLADPATKIRAPTKDDHGKPTEDPRDPRVEKDGAKRIAIVNKKRYDVAACVVEAFKDISSESDTWAYLGHLIHAFPEYTSCVTLPPTDTEDPCPAATCIKKSIVCARPTHVAWQYMKNLLRDMTNKQSTPPTIIVKGTVYDAEECQREETRIYEGNREGDC